MVSPGLEAHRPRSLAEVRDELRERLAIVNDQRGLLLCCMVGRGLPEARQIDLARILRRLGEEAQDTRSRLAQIKQAME